MANYFQQFFTSTSSTGDLDIYQYNEEKCLYDWVVDKDIVEVEDDYLEDLEDLDDEDNGILGIIENFNAAYNFPEIDIEIVVKILQKKNSERSGKEKQIIRDIVKSNKEEKPKIEIERQNNEEDGITIDVEGRGLPWFNIDQYRIT